MSALALLPNETVIKRGSSRFFERLSPESGTTFLPKMGTAYLTTHRFINRAYSYGWFACGGLLGLLIASACCAPSSVIDLPLTTIRSVSRGERRRGGRPLVLATDAGAYPIFVSVNPFVSALDQALRTYYRGQLVETAKDVWTVYR